MQNHILDDYLDELKLQLKHLPLAERRQVDRDIRAHLEQEVKERRKADKTLSEDEAVLAATHAFGDPKDIGISYGAGGGIVRRSTGEVVLHVAVWPAGAWRAPSARPSSGQPSWPASCCCWPSPSG